MPANTGERGDPLLNVSFFGVRGSTPCPCDANRRYGGNTSCVALEAPGHDPIVLDLGTGLRFWGETLDPTRPFAGSALVTHIHWDHVQGLPFFTPVLKPGARFDVYGPPQADARRRWPRPFDEFMRPPFFPVTTKDLLGDIRFHDVWDADLELDGAKVKVPPGARTSASPTATGSRWAARRSPTSPTTRCRSTAATRCPTRCSSCATAPTC